MRSTPCIIIIIVIFTKRFSLVLDDYVIIYCIRIQRTNGVIQKGSVRIQNFFWFKTKSNIANIEIRTSTHFPALIGVWVGTTHCSRRRTLWSEREKQIKSTRISTPIHAIPRLNNWIGVSTVNKCLYNMRSCYQSNIDDLQWIQLYSYNTC